MQKDQLGDFGLPDVCLTIVLHDGLHYNTFQYCFVNIFLSDRYMVVALQNVSSFSDCCDFTPGMDPVQMGRSLQMGKIRIGFSPVQLLHLGTIDRSVLFFRKRVDKLDIIRFFVAGDSAGHKIDQFLLG